MRGGGGRLRNVFFIFIKVYKREEHHHMQKFPLNWFCMNYNEQSQKQNFNGSLDNSQAVYIVL